MIEWKAAAYADIADLQQWLADTSLAGLVLRDDARVLDIGCGDGRVTEAIAARVPRGRVQGVDVSHDMIAFARARHPRSNLAFEVCDALDLGRLCGPFDVVTSFNALHWVQQQEQVLRHIHGLLAEGGYAFIQMVGHGERKSLEHVIREVCGTSTWRAWLGPYGRPYDHVAPDVYRAMAARCGFAAEISQELIAWDFKSREAFMQWAQATFQYWTKHLPEGRAGAFINDVLDAYRQVGDGSAADANVFHFYQMKSQLSPL